MKMGLLGFNSEPEFQKLSDMVAGCQKKAPGGKADSACRNGIWQRNTQEFTTDYLYASWTLGDKKIFEIMPGGCIICSVL